MNNKDISKAFSKAATSYDEYAHMQNYVVDIIIEKLSIYDIKPKRILDIGCGTGLLTHKIKDIYPKAKVIGVDLSQQMCDKCTNKSTMFRKVEAVCGDAHALPFAADSFDLVVSSNALHWCDDLPQVFNEVFRVSKEQGIFLFSMVAYGSMIEFVESWAKVDTKQHVNEFKDMHDIGDTLLQTGWQNTVMDVERFKYYYKNISLMHTELKSLGVTSKNKNHSIKNTKKFIMEYNQLKNHKGLPISWEIAFGHAVMPKHLSAIKVYKPL